MATMEELFSSAGIPWVELDPRDQFGAYTTQQFSPFSPARAAFQGMREPMMQQFYLTQPTLEDYGSFADYMGQYNVAGWEPYGDEGLRTRAEQAATMAGLTPSQFFQYVAPMAEADYDTPAAYQAAQITPDVRGRVEALSPAQQLMYRQTYGTGEYAEANQLALAQLLARQQADGGMYGGQYGTAISRALGELSGQLMARNPGANFLDWYLQRTTNGGAQGLFNPPTAETT